MAGLIEGYEYDIFISYRQKDNKHDGWVTKFVDNLKGELEATFKEDVSVYFDENPHDRLQETHIVDKSLEGKLKCLIFIPILSQTYCDPKSYAWQYEFLEFLRMTENDRFGKDVKLRSGNVASRILPIRIHDLEQEDIKVFEKETGSVLRAMDFVFKTSTGVNRPLKADEDHPQDNLNKIYYSDQINKVANSIKEIILGLRTDTIDTLVKDNIQQRESLDKVIVEKKRMTQAKPFLLSKNKLLLGFVVIAILVIISIFVYPKIFKQDRLEYLRSKGKISVAVMPFQNMSENTALNNWQDMIQFMLTSLLSEDLEVRQSESVEYLVKATGITNYASFTPSLARTISKKLDASVFIQGGILQVGPSIRIDAQLLDTKKGTIIKSFPLDVPSEEKLNPKNIESLADMIKEFIVLSELTQKKIPDQQLSLVSTSDQEAYRNYFDGKKSYAQRDWNDAAKYFSEAIRIDSNFTFATILLSWTYSNSGRYEESKKLLINAYKKKDQIPQLIKIKLEDEYARTFEGPQERIKYLKQFRNYDDQDPHNYSDLGTVYNQLGQYNNAIPEFNKALDIYKKWGTKPFWIFQYTRLGKAYHETEQYRKEKVLYRQAEKDFLEDPELVYRQAVLSLTEGKIDAANKYIEKYKSICTNNSWSDSRISVSIASIYSEAGILNKAEDYFREALSLQHNAARLNALAYYLIDNDRNINEGLELVDEALELSPDNYAYLDTKGWGLYKQGKYQEAKDILQKSWDLRMKNAIYNYPAFLHLESAKKAVDRQK